MSGRLAHALDAGEFALPEGRILLIGMPELMDLVALPRERTTVIVNHFPDHELLTEQGWEARVLGPGDVAAARALKRFDLALVALPRAKAAVRGALALAEALAPEVVVNGSKEDGVELVLREVKGRAEVAFVHSKAHGKVFGYPAAGTFDDWAELARPVEVDGFWTVPGAFSADGPDPGSVALAEALPPLKGRVADLGAGWGYLSLKALERSPEVVEIDLIEADFATLEAAKRNVTDPRARFHWGDARDADRTLLAVDAVIMNPPFHTGHAANPKLGQDFIKAAKALLKRDGVLYMVANRQLPYEQVLSESFDLIQVMETEAVRGFKLIRASGPKLRTRQGRQR